MGVGRVHPPADHARSRHRPSPRVQRARSRSRAPRRTEIETQIMQKVEGCGRRASATCDNITSLRHRGPGHASSSSSRSARRSIGPWRTCAMRLPRCAATCRRASRSRMVHAHGRRRRRIRLLTRSADHRSDPGAAVLVRRQYRHQAAADASPASRRCRAAAASTARSASSSIPRACRRSASPRSQVNQQLRALNLDAAGGRAQVGGGEQAIRVLGERAHARRRSATRRSSLPGGRFARLRDIADVHDGVGEMRTMARLNGRPATTFGVFKAKGASDVTVAKAVRRGTRQDQQARIPQVHDDADLHHRRLHRCAPTTRR